MKIKKDFFFKLMLYIIMLTLIKYAMLIPINDT